MKYLQNTFFNIFFIMIGLIAGAFIASLTITNNEGFVGGATVFWGGAIGAFLGLIMGIVVSIKIKKPVIKNIISILGFLILLGCIIFFKMSTTPIAVEEDRLPPIQFASYIQPSSTMGIGIASPKFSEIGALYFYSPNLEKSVDEHTPSDSVSFEKTELGTEISFAPPWLFPQNMKMDYGILAFKVIAIRREWSLLEVNRVNGKTAWVNSFDINFISWEQFILNVHSIELIDPNKNPLRNRPFDYSDPVQVQEEVIFTPIEIRNEWMKVSIQDNSYKKIGEGWIRWRALDQLLVSYSLLS